MGFSILHSGCLDLDSIYGREARTVLLLHELPNGHLPQQSGGNVELSGKGSSFLLQTETEGHEDFRI